MSYDLWLEDLNSTELISALRAPLTGPLSDLFLSNSELCAPIPVNDGGPSVIHAIDCRGFEDLSVFKECSSLTELQLLWVDPSTELKSLRGVERFEKLEFLVLCNCDGLESLAGLENLPKLSTVFVCDSSGISDYSALLNVRSLRSFRAQLPVSNACLSFVEQLKMARPECAIELFEVLKASN